MLPRWLLKLLRPFRASARFLRANWLFATGPRQFGDNVIAGVLPAGMGPRLFAAIAIGLMFLWVPIQPQYRPGWTDVVDDLSIHDEAEFCALLGVDPLRYEKYYIVEQFWPGASPVSAQVASRAKSTEDSDVEIFLAARDVGLARRYAAAAKYSALESKIVDIVWKAVTLPLLLIGCLVLIAVAKRRPLPQTTRAALSTYFLGYYLFIFLLTKVLFYPFEHTAHGPLVWTTAVETFVIVYLFVVLYIYFCHVCNCSKRRLTLGLAASAVAQTAILLSFVSTVSWIFTTPWVSGQLHRLAGT